MDLIDEIREFCNFSLVGEYSCPPENLRASEKSSESFAPSKSASRASKYAIQATRSWLSK